MTTFAPGTLAMASQQDDPHDLLSRGIRAAREGNRVKARFLVRQAVAADPSSAAAWLQLAELSDRADERLDYLRRVAGLNPSPEQAAAVANALVLHGAAAARRGQPGEARDTFRLALQTQPASVPALLGSAAVAESSAEAVKLYDRVLALDPANATARNGLTHLHATVGERCPICLTAVETGAPVCPLCRSVISLDDPAAFDDPTRCDAERVSGHLPRLQRAAEADPSELLSLGLAYLNLGQPSLATKTLTAAALRREEHPQIRERIYRLVERQVSGKSTVRMKRLARPAAPGPDAPLVVVADDSATIRAVVSAALNNAGYRTAGVCDGSEIDAAIQLEGVPALVVLDVDMPCVGGFAACKSLRRRDDTRDVPVIFLTANDGLVSKLRGKMAGGTEYLTKPFQPAQLVAAVARLAPRHQPTAKV